MVSEHVDGKNKGKVMLCALSTCGWLRKDKGSPAGTWRCV